MNFKRYREATKYKKAGMVPTFKEKWYAEVSVEKPIKLTFDYLRFWNLH